jgi:hypothetical protein
VLIYVAFQGQRRQIIHQEEAIELNRVELAQTREELRGQKEQLELQKQEMQVQNQLALKQGFETTFFELLRFHREATDTLKANPGGGPVRTPLQGQEAFEHAAAALDSRLSVPPPKADHVHMREAALSEAFNAVCLADHSDFGHYFRTLYHLIRLADESAVEDKERYTSIVRAQMSNAELLVLMVNGLSDIGRAKFKPLIEKYALLEPLRITPCLRQFKHSYKDEAYGDRAREIYFT